MTILRFSRSSIFTATIVSIVLALFAAGCPSAAINAADPSPDPLAGSSCGSDEPDPPDDPTPTEGIKWHPGAYVWYSPPGVDGVSGYRADLAVHRQRVLDFIESIKDEPSIRGIQLVVFWRALEGDTPGDYTAGFAAIDEILARLAKYNKRLMLGFQTVVFGGFASIYDIFPRYVVDDGRYGVTELGFYGYGGMTALTWQRDTGDRVVALSQAYGARYDAAPNFEMLTLGETALQVPFGVEGFSNQAVLAELQHILTAARGHWPHTALRVGANDLAPDPLMTQLFKTCADLHVAVGGPDVWPLDVTQADRVFVGLDDQHRQVYTDYRDQLPWSVEIQWQSFGGQFTLAQLHDATMSGYTAGGFAMPSMKTKYLIWYVNESNGNASTQWLTAELPFIRAHSAPYSTDCPSLYPACNPN
jgi:hypothetical protein